MSDQAPAKKISVQADGDFELWVVSGKLPDGFQYSLPIKVRPHKSDVGRFYFVGRTMPLTARQFDELVPILDAFDHAPGDERGWWLTEANLKKIAAKAPGCTFEYYIAWPGHVPPKLDEEDDAAMLAAETEPGLSPQEMIFLKRVHYVLGDLGWEELKLLFLAIKKEAKRVLVDERKILDLGFVRLAYVPYRVNWRELLAVRFGAIISAFRKTPTARHEALTEAGVYHALASVKLLAIEHKDRFIRWTLEALPSLELEHALEEQEYAKLQSIGPAAYAKWILGWMSKRLKLTLEILRSYARSVSVPPAEIRQSNSFGSVRLVPALEPNRVRPGKGICETLELSPQAAFEQFSDEPSEISNLKSQISEKVEVPNFLATTKAFRNLIGNGELVKTRSKTDRGTILSPNQGPNPEKPPSHNNGAPTAPGPASSNGTRAYQRASDPLPVEPPGGIGEETG